MADIPSPSLFFDRFVALVAAMVESLRVRVRVGAVPAGVGAVVERRVRLVRDLVTVLFRRLQDGTLRDWVRGAGARGKREGSGRRQQGTGARAWASVPRRPGWLCPMMPCTERFRDAGGYYMDRLSALLAEPEMKALLAAHPRIGLALRPLCRMLGVPAALYLDVRAPSAEELAAAAPSIVSPPAPPPEQVPVGPFGVIPWYHQKWANGRW